MIELAAHDLLQQLDSVAGVVVPTVRNAERRPFPSPAAALANARVRLTLASILRTQVDDVALRDERTPEYRRRVQFRLLGPLQVDALDGPVPLGGPKQRAVLANLLVRPNQVVPADTLIDEVWGDEPPGQARNTLQTYVSNLRKALGEGVLEGRAPGYVLVVDPLDVDASRFDALVRDARNTLPIDPKVAIDTLDDALSLWRGPALADVAERSLLAEAARLDELRLEAQEERVGALLATGSAAQAIAELEPLLARHPLRERLWEQLMLALYREGRQADALASFLRVRQILAEELGIDPSAGLVRLHEQILAQDRSLELRGEPLRGYRLLEKLGETPSGIRFRATQPRVGRDVEVEVFHEHVASAPTFVERFEPEAQAVAALEHPHIVPMYDYWREPGRAYVVRRYLPGPSLLSLAERGEELDRSRVLLIVEQVSSALAFAHGRGVAHGDIDDANVIFDADGDIYLKGFAIGTGATPIAGGRCASGRCSRTEAVRRRRAGSVRGADRSTCRVGRGRRRGVRRRRSSHALALIATGGDGVDGRRAPQPVSRTSSIHGGGRAGLLRPNGVGAAGDRTSGGTGPRRSLRRRGRAERVWQVVARASRRRSRAPRRRVGCADPRHRALAGTSPLRRARGGAGAGVGAGRSADGRRSPRRVLGG